MHEEYHKWHSKHLQSDFEMLTFGKSGYPLVLFPTSQGTFYQNKDFGLVETLSKWVKEEKIKIYCPDSIDKHTWYDHDISPSERVARHELYNNLLLHDIVPQALKQTKHDKVIVVGCSFGGYHAVNFALRHPQVVSAVISMGGTFDVRKVIGGNWNGEAYFHNPIEYLPGLADEQLLQHIKTMFITLGTGEFDVCLNDNLELSAILNAKEINHHLDIRAHAVHDWPVWKKMLPDYVEQFFAR